LHSISAITESRNILHYCEIGYYSRLRSIRSPDYPDNRFIRAQPLRTE